MDNLVGPLVINIGGEAKEEQCEDVVLEEVELMVVEEVDAVVDQVEDRAVLDRMIL